MTDKGLAAIETVVDVARCVVTEWEAKGCPITSLGVECCELRYALKSLDAEHENDMEYKWLHRGFFGLVYIAVDRPSLSKSTGYTWPRTGNKSIDAPPAWLKPGQLWERLYKYTDNMSTPEMHAQVWSGYWWRLVDDHSKPVPNDNPWITSRRPAEDDAWVDGDGD